MYELKKPEFTNIVFTYIIILMPILNIYSALLTSRLGLGTFIMLIFCIAVFNKTLGSLNINSILIMHWCYLLYLIIITLLVAMLIAKNTFNYYILIICFYSIVFSIYVPRYFNLLLAEKFYFLVCFIASIFLFIQVLLFRCYDTVLPGVLKIVQLYAFEDNISYLQMNEMFLRFNMFRPSSFFTEPSHFALYIVPCINLLLYNKFVKLYLFYSIIFSVAVILTYSANGLVLILLTWTLWFLSIIFTPNLKTKKNEITILFLLLVLSLLIFIKNDYVNIQNLNYTYDRILTVLTLDISYSNNLRIFRGFSLFNQLNLLDKCLGIGYGDLKNLMVEYDLYDQFSNIEIYDYMSSISRILLSTGVLGFILYLLFIANLYKNTRNYKSLILILIIMFLSTSTLYSHYSVLIYSFIVKDALDGRI